MDGLGVCDDEGRESKRMVMGGDDIGALGGSMLSFSSVSSPSSSSSSFTSSSGIILSLLFVAWEGEIRVLPPKQYEAVA